jgi:hypothetical protein
MQQILVAQQLETFLILRLKFYYRVQNGRHRSLSLLISHPHTPL